MFMGVLIDGKLVVELSLDSVFVTITSSSSSSWWSTWIRDILFFPFFSSSNLILSWFKGVIVVENWIFSPTFDPLESPMPGPAWYGSLTIVTDSFASEANLLESSREDEDGRGDGVVQLVETHSGSILLLFLLWLELFILSLFRISISLTTSSVNSPFRTWVAVVQLKLALVLSRSVSVSVSVSVSSFSFSFPIIKLLETTVLFPLIVSLASLSHSPWIKLGNPLLSLDLTNFNLESEIEIGSCVVVNNKDSEIECESECEWL